MSSNVKDLSSISRDEAILITQFLGVREVLRVSSINKNWNALMRDENILSGWKAHDASRMALFRQRCGLEGDDQYPTVQQLREMLQQQYSQQPPRQMETKPDYCLSFATRLLPVAIVVLCCAVEYFGFRVCKHTEVLDPPAIWGTYMYLGSVMFAGAAYVWNKFAEYAAEHSDVHCRIHFRDAWKIFTCCFLFFFIGFIAMLTKYSQIDALPVGRRLWICVWVLFAVVLSPFYCLGCLAGAAANQRSTAVKQPGYQASPSYMPVDLGWLNA